jgi:hypothetical protein
MDEERLTPSRPRSSGAASTRRRRSRTPAAASRGPATAARPGRRRRSPPTRSRPASRAPADAGRSITGDPTTPYDAGIRLAEALGGSLLTVEGEQHTVVESGANACVADIAAAYLVDLRTPPPDARCVLGPS